MNGRTTIINEEKDDGGWIFEDLLLEGIKIKTKDNEEKIQFNIETAIDLLNIKIYKKGIKYFNYFYERRFIK